MQSEIARALGMKYGPVAIVRSDAKPEGAKQFKEGRWGCVMMMLAAAAKGQTAVFDRRTFGCPGGGVGLGFGNQYVNFAGGEDGFCYFLSCGNEQWEKGRKLAEVVKPFLRDEAMDNFIHGERYMKSPERVRQFLNCLPIIDVPERYVIFKPLSEVDAAKETAAVVVALSDVDQFAALVVLANYDADDNERVIIPYAAGCMSIAIYPFREAASATPRAVAGLVDLSARHAIKRQLHEDLLTLAAPYAMWKAMEANVPGSFLERHTWKELRKSSKEREADSE